MDSIKRKIRGKFPSPHHLGRAYTSTTEPAAVGLRPNYAGGIANEHRNRDAHSPPPQPTKFHSFTSFDPDLTEA